ncbi:hypothetical protein KKF84_07575 [Myxococcota bacterium]|nr:hypothetical protein [Myxococcota bacterium]
MRLFIILHASALLMLLMGCEDKPSSRVSPDKPRHPASMKKHMAPGMHPSHLDKKPLIFPKTLCGNIVRRIMECEKERINAKYAVKPKLAQAKSYSIDLKFKTKLNKYLEHCEKTAQGLAEANVEKCLALSCPLMDNCMKSLPGIKKKSGKK